MEDKIANLNLANQEEELVQGQEDEDDREEEFNLYLVGRVLYLEGRVLTDNVVHFSSMRNVIAELWHPLEGVSITEIEEKRVLFRFYNEIDLKSVVDSSPEAEFWWDISLRGPLKMAVSVTSRWLREESREVGKIRMYKDKCRDRRHVGDSFID
ncbi:hypothetical protein Goarm_004500 [Gossypium armourianum]|uniref:DUF4283 domain-containing protein n=1 Tax=Gossypium armourianum TaxID=34283 RepID=A0A7J9JWZ1_9ROSI|nr:hypothetical protein [Gossypium armourianum]